MGSAAVVGAGPAGATLAYLLAERGVQVTLLERHGDLSREFRGERLLKSGFDALRQMGLEATVQDLPQHRIAGAEVYRDRKLFFRADFDDNGPVYLPQPLLLEAIIRRAEEQFPQTFRFARASTVRDLLRDGDSVVGVAAEGPEGFFEVRADLVFGCDGRTSLVRRKAGLEAVRSDHPDDQFDIAWARAPMATSMVGTDYSRMYLGQGHVVGVLTDPFGNLQFAWIIDKGAFGDLRRRGHDQLVASLAEHVGDDLASHLNEHREEVTFSLLDVYSTEVEKWSAPGVVLVGDAAHTMSPNGGQGINMALRDTIVAANHLAPVLASSPTPQALMGAADRFQTERLPEIEHIQAHQRRIPVIRHQRTPMSKAATYALPMVGRMFPQVLRNLMGGSTRLVNGFAMVRLDPAPIRS